MLHVESSPLAQKISIIALTLNSLRDFNYKYWQNFANNILLTITVRMTFLLGEKDVIGIISGIQLFIIIMTNNRKESQYFLIN